MNPRRHDLLALAILTSLITILFADVLIGASSLYERDLLTYSYPGKKVLRDVVLGGEFPYWNRALSGGQPLAANPAHEVFYPFTWLILLPGYAYGLQLFIALHVYLAAWSMYALLRSLAISPPSSFFGALSFALGGLFLSYLTLLPFLASVVWMPVTLLFMRRFVLHRRRRDFALSAAFFGMMMLVGEPTTILQTGMLAGIYAISTGAKRRALTAVALISLTALLAGAVAILPAIDHASDSVRGRGLPFVDVVDRSMPAIRIGELVHAGLLGTNGIPGQRLYWGSVLYERNLPFLVSLYPGLLITALAVAGVVGRVRGSGTVLAVLSISVLLALGGLTPLWRALYESGIARSIRYPEKFILMGVFALLVFAPRVLDLVLRGDERVRRAAMRVAVAITIAGAIGVALVVMPFYPSLFASVWTPSRSLLLPMVAESQRGWLLLLVRGALLLVLIRAVGRIRQPRWIALAGAFVLLDLGLLLPDLAKRIEPGFLSEQPAVLRNLPASRAEFRVFHHAAWHRDKPQVAPYYGRDAELRWVNRNAAMPLIPIAHGVQLAMIADYDYTALLPTTDFLDAVTTGLPPVRRDWVEVAASMSNVWYRAVYLDPRIQLPRARNDRRVLEPAGLLRLERAPRYSFATHLETVHDRFEFVQKLAPGKSPKGTAFIAAASFQPAAGTVLRVDETANSARIDVETKGRAFLVMSVTPHKYWRITVDGHEAPAIVTNIGYQGVVVPAAGRHVIAMRYRNPLISVGGAISLATLLALCVVAARPITMRAL